MDLIREISEMDLVAVNAAVAEIDGIEEYSSNYAMDMGEALKAVRRWANKIGETGPTDNDRWLQFHQIIHAQIFTPNDTFGFLRYSNASNICRALILASRMNHPWYPGDNENGFVAGR